MSVCNNFFVGKFGNFVITLSPMCCRINPMKLINPQVKLEAFLARDRNLKESAQRAFVAYFKSVFLMKDKKVFKINALNPDTYAR